MKALSAITLLDNVASAVNAGTTTTIVDPTAGASTTRLTLNSATCALRLPGATGHVNFVSAKRTQSGSNITGDLDVRIKITPAQFGTAATLVQKESGSNGTRGWQFAYTATGALQFSVSTDAGATLGTRSSTLFLPFAAGQTFWARVVMDVDNGASGNDVIFYTSRDGTTWTQLGTTVTTAGTATIASNSIDFTLGQNSAGVSLFVGDIHAVEVRSGIGGSTALPTDPASWSTSSTGTQTTYAAVSAPPVGTRLKLQLVQDATGGRLVTWPGNVKWAGGYAPVLSTIPNAVDYFEADWVDGASWYIRTLQEEGAAQTGRVDIQKFTASGTWTKPPWAVQVEMILIGGGGGGGSGRRGAGATLRCAGAGGAGANKSQLIFDAADLRPTHAVTVGAGGAGGVAPTSDNTDGAAGAAGGNTFVTGLMQANGGAAGGAGTSTVGGVGGIGQPGAWGGSNGANASGTGGAGSFPTVFGGGGPSGGSGGGVTAADAEGTGGGVYNSSDSGSYNSFVGGAVATAGTTGAAATPLNAPLFGQGGPGGGGGAGRAGGAGAAGSKYGTGGGGAGASSNGFTGGAGGAGGAGIAWIISRG